MIADASERYGEAAVLRLITGGVLTDPSWRDALRELPRERFVTAYHTPVFDGAGSSGWQRHVPGPASGDVEGVALDPRWLGVLHGPDPLVVGLSGTDAWGRRVPVSLSPALVATVTMLQVLAPRPGHRVLELGTGIGHTAALLTHRVGERQVSTVEIDPDLHTHARARLRAVGLHPLLVLGDGVDHCDRQGYDRVLVGHSVDHIPSAWPAVVRPGGRLLLGLRGSLGAGHHVLLHHQVDSATGLPELSGDFLDWTCTLPPLRHRARRRAVRRPLEPLPGPVRTTSTALPAPQLAENTPLALLCQLHLPVGTTYAVRADATGARASYLRAPDGSWTEVSHSLDRRGRHDVRWAGTTVLPRLLDTALQAYQDLRSPTWTDLGLTATTRGTRIWHGPTGTSWPLLGAGGALPMP